MPVGELVACAADGDADVVAGAALVGVVVAADGADDADDAAPVVVGSADETDGADGEVVSLSDGAVGVLVGGADAGTSSVAEGGTV